MKIWVSILALSVALIACNANGQSKLETELRSQSIDELAARSHVFGDPKQGALRFFRPELSCIQCHTAGAGEKQLGPDLSKLGERSTYTHVIESLLDPAKLVQPEYRSERLLLDDGRVIIGIVKQESPQELTLLVPGEDELQTFAIDQIEARAAAGSIMPSGLINSLSEPGEFYDLVSFMVELGRGGPEHAADWTPDPALIQPPPLPEYERDLDHKGLIASWNDNAFKNGQKLYSNLCVNCHGTRDQVGSFPNALRFADGKFKNGSDPLAMYRTLTHGYKLMLPQHQLVPREKYDVIHYIRESYLKPFNKTQYTTVDDQYLATLPTGRHRGPAPIRSEPWSEMDYGPFLTHTYEIVDEESKPRPEITDEDRRRDDLANRPAERTWPADTNFAYKGIAIRLDHDQSGTTQSTSGAADIMPGGIGQGSAFVVFEHDTLRVAGAWTGPGFIDWEGILLDGKHWRSPRSVGDTHFENLPGPGWANPLTGSFQDTRQRARDGQAYGPFPPQWMNYKGLYKHGNRVILSYTVGDAAVLESHRIGPGRDDGSNFARDLKSLTWIRSLNIGKSTRDMAIRVAPQGSVQAAIGGADDLHPEIFGDDIIVRIPATRTPVNIEIHLARPDRQPFRQPEGPAEDLSDLIGGGPAQWPQVLNTEPSVGDASEPFAVDELTRPIKNPWNSRLRMSGLDFFPDGDSLVACCCDGDVWIIRRIAQPGGTLQWRRIASGLFHPLGIKVVDDKIFVNCRDQIVILNDLNGDGETDHYQSFNHDHQVTEHFHEFAMGLQSDSEGNLYYAKSARHAQDSLIPQHGTLLKVNADGSRTTILANGFRAANGVCLNPDGSFFVTDQEGHWTPMNRINRVVQGGFYGNMYSFDAPPDTSDSAMQPPLCWPNKLFDRSPSELLWVNSKQWGALDGGLLSLSYGYGKIFIVPHEQVNGKWQGGMCRLPLPAFETGIMRGRFHSDGHLYACGMNAWGSSQTSSPGGLYRIRATGHPMHLPAAMHVNKTGITLKFTDPVDTQVASNPDNYLIETWDLVRSANYGSSVFNEQRLSISDVQVDHDGRTVHLQIPSIQPTWTIQVAYKLRGESGSFFSRVIQGTIHELADEKP